MVPPGTQSLELHVRFDPAVAARLRGLAAGTERSLAGCVRLLVKDGLDRLDARLAAADLQPGDSLHSGGE
jgi:hypothetical protein